MRQSRCCIVKLPAMNWYGAFNVVEAVLWLFVAVVIPFRAKAAGSRQRLAITMGSVAFVAFGVSDLLEVGREGAIPLWLRAYKVACGVAIYAARFTWRGWSFFRIRDREVLFGIGCVIAVVVLVSLQWQLKSLGVESP